MASTLPASLGQTESVFSQANLQSFADILRSEWKTLRSELNRILDAASINHVNHPSFIIGFSPYEWGTEQPGQVQQRADFIDRYDRWFERFTLLFPSAIPTIADQIQDADELIRSWIARSDSNSWSVPKSIDDAFKTASRRLAPFEALIDQRAPSADAVVLAIIDTNCLLREPELATYASFLPGRPTQLVFPPVVIAELEFDGCGHAFVQNLQRGHYKLGVEARHERLRIAAAFDELTVMI